jgi:nitrogen fixation/metabolism regulation signal transduction histidine kinase
MDFGQQDFTTDYIVLINELNNANKELQIANQSIKNQKKYIDAVLDNIPLNIVVFDPELRFQYINKQAIKDDQLREYLIGKTEYDYWNFKKLPHNFAQSRLKSVIQSGEERRQITIEETLYKDTDKEKTYLRTSYPHYENDQLLFYINYGTEITELAKTENN